MPDLRIKNLLLSCIATALIIAACQQPEKNPPAPGFDAADSDARAIELADKVMQAMGGRDAWDNTRYITWKFFGRRFHVWDKSTGDMRVEFGDKTILMNLHNHKGRVWHHGSEYTHPDSLEKYLDQGYRAWINDSYWLVMPYKLKDSGVTLKYAGTDTMTNGTPAEVVQLTFSGVGVTPQNKYKVYINPQNFLVQEWAFFTDQNDAQPRFKTPWLNWQKFGKIRLSADRGRNSHTDIAVFDELPASVFHDPAPVDMHSFVRAEN